MQTHQFVAKTDVEIGDVVTIPGIDEGPIIIHDILCIHSARTGLVDWKFILKVNGITLALIGRGLSNEDVVYSEEYCCRCGLVHGVATPMRPAQSPAFVERKDQYADICDEGLRTIAMALAMGETVEFKEHQV